MSSQELKKIMKLAIARRNTLVKQLHKAQAKYDDCACDRIMMRLQGENELIGDCKRSLGVA